MSVELSAATFFAFLLALVRASAWVALAPPFSSMGIPVIVKSGLAAALALAVSSQFATTAGISGAVGGVASLSTGAFVADVVLQVATGAAMGFITSLLLSAVTSAGSLIDMASGLSAAQTLDPISGTMNPVTANVYNVVMTTLLFATGGDLLVVKGFLTSFKAVGLTATSVGALGNALTSEIGFFFLASVEIAAPLFGVMFLAYVTLGLLTRTAPQLNVMSLGFAINVALSLVVVTACLPLLPGAVSTLLDRAVRDALGLVGVSP
jgi:flagellar biosynthetic protein FliR